MSDAAAATPRLRVAVLSRNFGARFGGAERYSVELVRELSATHEMHVFAQAFDHDLTGIQIHRVPRGFTRPRWLNQWWFAAWTAWATRRGFDVVHSHENTWHGDVQS
ncbi:MAG: glycosyltransferase family 1 protein, partial [Betaproteobacteria bacterium]|nr:glycosyltransferase family 1 protein [Betaproteobacteria bacterium]